jgi:serine-type D-Ala-D-Ala carboxypeptidase/endopeptidase
MLLRSARPLLLLLAIALAFAAPAGAQGVPSDEAIREILQTRVDSARAVGIVVGVVENGQRRYVAAGAAGEGRQPLDEHTLFEIGSITKVFNALLLADAVVRGEARLDQPVAGLLPAGTRVPSREGEEITLRKLATHRSGLPRLPSPFIPADPEDPYADYGADDLIAFLAAHELEHTPGMRGEYSNLGAGLLGFALAHRAGTSWEALARERVLAPLGMRETFQQVPPEAQPRFSQGFSNRLEPVSYWNVDALAGAGALRSTAADMLTFLEAGLAAGSGPLGRAMALSQEAHAPIEGSSAMMGLGWQIRSLRGSTVHMHGGGTGGFAAVAALDRERGVGVVVLSNAAVPVDDILLHLLAPEMPPRMPPVPVRRTEIALPAAQLDRVVGRYMLMPTFHIEVTREGDALFGQATGQQRFRLYPASPERFFVREVDAEMEFHFEGDGPAVAATLHQGGAAQRLTRVQ